MTNKSGQTSQRASKLRDELILDKLDSLKMKPGEVSNIIFK